MPTYRFVWPTGDAAPMTARQYERARRTAELWNMGSTITVQPVFMQKGAVAINTGTMTIVILPDGSSHS